MQRCSPCHIANPSGGLSMANAEISYASLVGQQAAGAGCTDRVRVVPGDAASSYIIAKLRNIQPICGLPMPPSMGSEVIRPILG